MNTDWPYLTVSADGKSLVNDNGEIEFTHQTALDASQWEQWLEDNDYRGSIR